VSYTIVLIVEKKYLNVRYFSIPILVGHTPSTGLFGAPRKGHLETSDLLFNT